MAWRLRFSGRRSWKAILVEQRINPGEPFYAEMENKWLNSKKPTEFTYMGFVWYALQDNEIIAFVKVRPMDTFDGIYAQTTFRK